MLVCVLVIACFRFVLDCADFVEFAVVSGASNCLVVGAAQIKNAMLCCCRRIFHSS